MNVIQYLKTFNNLDNGLDDLNTNYGIDITKYDDRIVLNYNQINSHHCRFEPMVKECRSLILSYPKLQILSRSFDRFFNYGEDKVIIDLSISKLFEKADGTLINVYHDNNKWEVSTRKMAFAEGKLISYNGSFKDLFFEGLNIHNEDEFQIYMKDKCQDFTYIFELCSPYNRIVTRYDNIKIYYLNSRNKYTGKYFYYNNNLDNVYNLNLYNFDSIENIQSSMKELNVLDEGYVLFNFVDETFIKIKNPAYLIIHALRNSSTLGNKAIIENICRYEEEEYLSYFPEDRVIFQKFIDRRDEIINNCNLYWNKYGNIKDKKEYALKVKDLPYSGLLFNKYNYNADFNETLIKMSYPSKEKIFNIT